MQKDNVPYQDLLDRAAGEKVAPIERCIPQQRLPSFIRGFFRFLFLPFIWLDLVAQKIASCIIRPPFKKGGSCLQRGNCCHYILMEKPKGFFGKLHYFWQTEINGFYKRQLSVFEDRQEMLVMGCRYLKKNGRCGIYHFRPMICRKWPIIEAFAKPRILKGCGYHILQERVKKRGKEK